MDVKIRPLRDEDAQTSVLWRNDPAIWVHTTFAANRVITLEDELNWMRKVLADPTGRRFAILADGSYVGNTYLTDLAEGTAEFHIFIGDRRYWGQGIATEASRLVIEFAQRTLRLEQVFLGVKPENKSALRIYERLGFETIGEKNGFVRMRLNLLARPAPPPAPPTSPNT